MKRLIGRYVGNGPDRTITFAKVSCAISAFIGLGQLIIGIYLLSPWFIANAVYYLMLCTARGYALKRHGAVKRADSEHEKQALEGATYRRSGIFTCLLGVSYLLVCLRMYFAGDATTYSGVMVYWVAFTSFVKLGLAIHGAVSIRTMKNPILSALQVISVNDAFVSIVITECALLTMERVENAAAYSALTGMVASFAFVIVGLLMLFRNKRPTHMPENISTSID